MPKNKRMFKHHLRELSKSFGSQIDPGKSEQLRRTKTDIENNLTRIQKLIKKEDQSKKEGNSRKETELVRLIEDFYNQYQSLYAIYGRLAGEYVRSPRRTESVPSFSSSSSDSEYLSAEDVDSNTEISRERERYSSLSNTYEIFKSLASTETKEIEDHLTAQTKELIESLNQQKKNLELQVESQTHEVKKLGAKNNELNSRVLELESLLKQSEDNEDQAMANIAESMARINNLEQEAKSLRNQKGKLEEKMKHSRNEMLNQKKEFTEQVNALQEKLDSAWNHNRELEIQSEREREKASQYLIRIENLKEKLAETMSVVEQSLLKEKERIMEFESRFSTQNDLEEQLRTEVDNLRVELETVQEQRNTLESQNEHSESIAKVENLNVELDSACNDKKELEREREKVSQYLIRIENLNESLAETTSSVEQSLLKEKESFLTRIKELESRCSKQNDLQEQLRSEVDNLRLENSETLAKVEELEEMIEQIRTEKQVKIWSKLKQNQQIADRKMEELAEQYRKRMEDNIRILHRRIHVAEQLNNENRNSCKITKQSYEQKIKMLEDELKLRAMPSQIEVNLNGLELVALYGLNLVEEHKQHVLGLVSKMLCEVQLAKDWVRKRNCEMKELEEKVDQLSALLSDKEEKELLLREKVWKLEANVNKEGGEKLNLMKTVSQLEGKVGKLEKKLKEKEEELAGLGEKKREAIRQLCFLIEFHRDRCVYLKDLMSKTRVSNGKGA